MGLTAADLLVVEFVGIKLSLFLGVLLGLEDVGDQVRSFVRGGVTGLTVGDSLVGEYVAI